MQYKLAFILMMVTSSCTTSNIIDTYKRTYKVSTPVMTSTKKQKLTINSDSSFILTDYKDEFSKDDSSVTYGVISKRGRKSYSLKDSITNNLFYIVKKRRKLYFYDCTQGKKYRYHNPFVKVNKYAP